MSEQAKIASLQEKIIDARNNARTFSILTYTTLLLAIGGFFCGGVIWYLSLRFLGKEIFFFAGIIGFILFFLSYTGLRAFDNSKKGLMTMLQNMSAKTPSCPRCYKQVPQGNYDFCPFCGNSLKH